MPLYFFLPVHCHLRFIVWQPRRVISSAFPYVATAFCAGAVSLVNAASAYFAPFRLFVFNAARAFPRQEFAASSAIEAARCYVFFCQLPYPFYICRVKIGFFPVFFCWTSIFCVSTSRTQYSLLFESGTSYIRFRYKKILIFLEKRQKHLEKPWKNGKNAVFSPWKNGMMVCNALANGQLQYGNSTVNAGINDCALCRSVCGYVLSGHK